MIFVSTLSAYTTLTEVIAQIMAHDSMLSRDRPSQGTPTVVKALANSGQSLGNEPESMIPTHLYKPSVWTYRAYHR